MESITQAKAVLRTRLAAALPAVLALADAAVAADALTADGIATPAPYVIEESERVTPDGYPAIELVDRSSRKVIDSTADCYEHRLVAAVTITGDDERTLTKWCERYMWAIRQFGVDRCSLVTAPFEDPDLMARHELFVGAEQYSPLLHGKSAGMEYPFVRGCFIELTIRTYE